MINQFVDHLLHITFLHRTLKTIIDAYKTIDMTFLFTFHLLFPHIKIKRSRSDRIKERSDAIAPKGAVKASAQTNIIVEVCGYILTRQKIVNIVTKSQIVTSYV